MGYIMTSKLSHSILLFTVIGEFFLPWILCRYYLLRKKTFQSYRFYFCFHWGHLLSEQDWFREYSM